MAPKKKFSPLASAWALAILSLMIMYGPSLLAHTRRSANPLIFNDDSRPYSWVFLQNSGGETHGDDYIADYWRNTLPIGYRALYSLASTVIDPRVLQKIIPYFLLLVLLGGIGFSAHRFAGLGGAWAAAALVLSSGVFMERMGGALPRGFAFPCVALIAGALTAGRPLWLAAVTVFSAGFYPPAAVLGGFSLFGLSLLPGFGEERRIPLKKRLTVVFLTAAVTFVVVLPSLVGSSKYGPLLRASQVGDYPEIGKGGRTHLPEDRAPYNGFWIDFKYSAQRAIENPARPWSRGLHHWAVSNRGDWLTALFLFVGGFFGWLALRDPAARRLLILLGASAVAHAFAKAVAPAFYRPQRYVLYSAPVLVPIMFAAASAAIPQAFGWIKKRPQLKTAVPVMAAIVVLLFLGGRGSPVAGINVGVEGEAKLFSFVADLPEDILVAGWPDTAQPVDSVPHLCRRRAFLTFEGHMVVHQEYVEELRKRMYALIAAYYATGAGPVRRLREEFGVTHLIVDSRHFGEKRAHHFQPFGWTIREAFDRMKTEGSWIEGKEGQKLRVFTNGPFVVYDLSRLTD